VYCGAIRHQVSILASIWTVETYVVIGLCLAFTVLSIAASVRALAPERFSPVNLTVLEDARASQYALALSSDNTCIHITGTFALGMAQRLTSLLDQSPGVTAILANRPLPTLGPLRSLPAIATPPATDEAWTHLGRTAPNGPPSTGHAQCCPLLPSLPLPADLTLPPQQDAPLPS